MTCVEFYYDFGSPASYLAWTRIGGICERAGATLALKPMLLGGVFKATGGASPVTVPAKGAWMMQDLQRFAQRYGVAFQLPVGFPVNTLPLMRGAVWARMHGALDAYTAAMFKAMWADGVDLREPAEMVRVVGQAGLDEDDFVAALQDPAVKKALIEATEAAVARGVFGAPTVFVKGEMHFGQDRLDWVERALAS